MSLCNMNMYDMACHLAKSKTRYEIAMEIEGSFAMWAREDSGSERTSGVAPTWGQAKSTMESILFIPTVFVIPTKLEICNPIKYQPWPFNYNGEKRKQELIRKGNPSQIRATVLKNVCYKIYAVVVNANREGIASYLSERAKEHALKNSNHAHSYEAQFNKRLKRGQNFRRPHLGWSEFKVSYAGILREETCADQTISMDIPFMTFSCFDQFNFGSFSPTYVQNVSISKGVLEYVK